MNPALDSKVQSGVRPDASWSSLMQVGAREVFEIMLEFCL
jgi:hypothetical protein